MRRLGVVAITGAALLLAVACGGRGDIEVASMASLSAAPTSSVSAWPSPSPEPTATPEVPVEEACPSAVVSVKNSGGEAAYLYTGWEEGGVICWTDIAGEVSYRVEGEVVYWVPPLPQKCDETPRPRATLADLVTSPAPEPEFAHDLPANTTRFQLPKHPDARLGIKDFTIHIEALDSDGNVMALGGTGVTKDAFCESPE